MAIINAEDLPIAGCVHGISVRVVSFARWERWLTSLWGCVRYAVYRLNQEGKERVGEYGFTEKMERNNIYIFYSILDSWHPLLCKKIGEFKKTAPSTNLNSLPLKPSIEG